MNLQDLISAVLPAHMNAEAQKFGRWVKHLSTVALPQWLAMQAARRPCACKTGPACNGALAISLCVACHEPTCLEHACVWLDGRVVCLDCVEAVRALRAAAPRPVQGWTTPTPREPPANGHAHRAPPQKTRRDHLETLGLGDGATAAEIKDAHKQLSFENHPDRRRGPRAKQEATRRLQELNEALAALTAEAA